MTSSFPNAHTMRGEILPPGNALHSIDSHVEIRTESRGSDYWQIAVDESASPPLVREEKIGLIVGSGRKAQTYLYWRGEELFELPASWWVASGTWMNSPGYRDGTANFERGASDRCLECHANAFHAKAPPRNRFDPASIEPGIHCQKCHGPAGDHVAALQAGTTAGASGLVNPSKLTRERAMDLCRLCHSGVGVPMAAPLSYQSGDVLEKYLRFKPLTPEEELDVHGSQAPALIRSACYVRSATMTCTTCHDVHRVQRDPAAYVQNCRQCHDLTACGLFAKEGSSIAERCIDCHMPLQKTSKIVMRVNGERFQPMVRNHTIGIYPADTADK